MLELLPRSRSTLEQLEELLRVRRRIQDSHSWDTLLERWEELLELVEDSHSIGTVSRPRKDHTCSYTWFTEVCTLLPEIKRIRKETIACKLL